MITVDATFIAPYIREGIRHANYEDSKQDYQKIKVHADGESPGDLLNERRPGESEHIFKYRKKIYQPKTKTVIMKVLNVLAKIRRSSDWSIKYDEKLPARIPKEQTLQNYCELEYPEFESLTKWLFDVALKQHVVDPNAVVLVHYYKDRMPLENEFSKPFTTIFNSDQVLDYVPGEYAVLMSDVKCTYKEATVTKTDGEIYYVATPESIFKFTQASSSKDKWNMEEYPHTAGQLPVFVLGGIVKKGGLYESRISGMIPSLNSAVTIYSDKQAELVQHVHSEKWIYQTQQCKECNGQGKIPKASGSIECSSCKGIGVVNTSPYSNLIINPNNLPLGEKSIPIPPAGYIQKADVAAMVTAISAEIKQEIWDAYSAVNMEFLMEAPMAESGLSKEVDRDELNNFVYGFAEDLVATLDRIYELVAAMRYGYLIQDKTVLQSLCPKVAVPEKYDLLSSGYYLERIKAARDAKVSPLILSAMEVEYAVKSMYNNPELANVLVSVSKLNPLPSVSEEDKMVMKSNGGISEKDYIISCNIVSFIQRASEEHQDFFKQEIKKQKEIIAGYAEEVMEANASAQVDVSNPESGN